MSFLLGFFLFCYSAYAGHFLDLKPLQPGTFSADCELVLKDRRVALMSSSDKDCLWEWVFFPRRSNSKLVVGVQARGEIFLESAGVQNSISESRSHTLRVQGRSLRVTFRVPPGSRLFGFETQPSTDSFWEAAGAVKIRAWRPDARRLNPAVPIGVNLEADYLLDDLNSQQRKKLLAQVARDGFHAVRLHKFFRRFLDDPKALRPRLQEILNRIEQYHLKLYLDGVSYPVREGAEPGYKGEIYYRADLQKELLDWFDFLAEMSFYNEPLLQSRALQWLGLFNENSLLGDSLSAAVQAKLLKLYTTRLQQGTSVLSYSGFKAQLMLESGMFFQKRLQKMGFRGQFFLNNSMLGGADARVSGLLSGSIPDRHLYFDYPRFNQGFKKVRNHSPIQFFKRFERLYRDMASLEGIVLSEVNLPWPNAWQHQLLPVLLALHARAPLKGIWFYDYRLRSEDFHQGGIFGVQRFQSIIEPLPLFADFLAAEPEVSWHGDWLEVRALGGRVRSGAHPEAQEAGLLSSTVWEVHGERHCYSFERGLGDRFDQQGTLQHSLSPKAAFVPCH